MAKAATPPRPAVKGQGEVSGTALSALHNRAVVRPISSAPLSGFCCSFCILRHSSKAAAARRATNFFRFGLLLTWHGRFLSVSPRSCRAAHGQLLPTRLDWPTVRGSKGRASVRRELSAPYRASQRSREGATARKCVGSHKLVPRRQTSNNDRAADAVGSVQKDEN